MDLNLSPRLRLKMLVGFTNFVREFDCGVYLVDS